MAFAIAVGLTAVAVVVLWVAVAREPGPAPDDSAIAYEQAWNRLDFSTLYDLSGDELRDGLRRAEFVAHKRELLATATATATPAPRGAVPVSIDQVATSGDAAHVVTVVGGDDTGGAVRNDLKLRRRDGRWVVTAYSLRSSEPPAAASGA
jgi:hypothetical protein